MRRFGSKPPNSSGKVASASVPSRSVISAGPSRQVHSRIWVRGIPSLADMDVITRTQVPSASKSQWIVVVTISPSNATASNRSHSPTMVPDEPSGPFPPDPFPAAPSPNGSVPSSPGDVGSESHAAAQRRSAVSA